MAIDFQSYNKLRSRVMRQISRLKQGGFDPKVNFPSMTDIKNSKSPKSALRNALNKLNKFIGSDKYSATKENIQKNIKKQKIAEKRRTTREKNDKALKAIQNIHNDEFQSDVGGLSRKQAREFWDYIEYRRSMDGDNAKYIYEYAEEFVQVLEADYNNLRAIEKDFEKYMADRIKTEANSKSLPNSNYSSLEVSKIFEEFLSEITDIV